jgi:hypothetical protein
LGDTPWRFFLRLDGASPTVKRSAWQTCSTPARTLESLRGRATLRKLRLFGCACCRSIWHLLRDEECRSAVEAAERFADGLLSAEDLAAARHRAEQSAALAWALWDDGTAQAQQAAAEAVAPTATTAAARASEYAAAAVQAAADGDLAAWKSEQRRQCGLLRDLFGDPWVQPEVPEQAWLEWGGGAVAAVAKAIDESGRFEDLPVLADALEGAGCTEEVFLGHLRNPSIAHVRGCWALDTLLEKPGGAP